MCKRARSSICISLADKQQCILIPGENTPQACYWSQQSCPSKKPTPCSFPLGREYSLLRARSIFCFVRQLVLVQIVFWAAKHGSFSLLVFLCVLYSLFIKLDCQLPQDSIGGFVFCSASSNRSSFPQKLKVASRKQEFFDDQSKYLSCITARGTVSVPLQHGSGPLLQPSITMRGTASVPLRYRFGTARALYYNAQRRRPVCVLQSFNSVGVMNFQANTKTNRNPQNATLTLVPALLQTGRSTLAPRHSEYSSRSTILNKGLGVGLAIDVSKVKLHFRVNLWPSFWVQKH